MCFARRQRPVQTAGLAFVIVLASTAGAWGAIMVIPGDQPWHNDMTPQGSEAVANLPGRIGGWAGPPFGGGQYHFSYLCEDTDEFNEALQAFAEIRTPRLELFVHDGPGRDSLVGQNKGGKGVVIDWMFVVWFPEQFHRVYNDVTHQSFADSAWYRQPVPAPRIDVYFREDGPIEWDKVKVPQRITVIDQRASAAPIKPQGGSVIEANVYDMATGRPVSDAVLRLSPSQSAAASQPAKELQAEGDEDGHIVLERIPTGIVFNVYIEAPGYAPKACTYINDEVPAYHGLEVDLSKAATISGTVVDEDGKPVQGVMVVAWQVMGIDGRGYGRYSGFDRPSLQSDDAGHFAIAGLPRGYAAVRCQSETYYSPLMPLMAVPAEKVEIRVSRTGTVRGRVTFPEGRTGERER
jgi:hypothetical protein